MRLRLGSISVFGGVIPKCLTYNLNLKKKKNIQSKNLKNIKKKPSIPNYITPKHL